MHARSVYRFRFFLAALLATGAPIAAQETTVGQAKADTASPTRILHAQSAERLRRNKGLTLQWIDWNRRGRAKVTVGRAGQWLLMGEQREANGPGRLSLRGRVTEIGRDYFLFDGTVRITDTPDRGRSCEKQDSWRFAITQNRRYWRIRSFEWCDGLTDYIDIYF